MQKKSLLVALFCGALCLTGCLKNEESASVVQVRNAKANELNSIATLNEAKAAAELIYANADATLKGAEAELKKAEAALVLAMAETEKVRAELLKTQVALQEVKVEEEGIELLKKAAELEILVAQAEVAQAKAEAQKQYWANELAQLIADAEVAAVENGLELMKAQDAVEKYILTQEGAKADSAKVYARKFFRAQEKVAELQVAELAARAARVLIENNAMSTREWIHNEIDKKDDTISANNERIAALKKYLDVDPETAKEEAKKAWTALNEAYNDYKVAETALTKAGEAQEAENNKKADFNNESYGWPTLGSKWYYAFKEDIQELFGGLEGGIYDDKHAIDETFVAGEITVVDKVNAGGIIVPSKENKFKTEFIPFWHNEATLAEPILTRYPNLEVVSKDGSDHVDLYTTPIAPATIYYDNIKGAIDKVIAFHEDVTEQQIAKLEEDSKEDIADVKERIAVLNDWVSVHKDYVTERETKVKAAETAYVTALEDQETYEINKKDAWKAFEEYMVVKYDVSRDLFMKRLEADTAEQRRSRDTLDALTNYNGLKTAFDGLKADFMKEKGVFETFIAAEGAFNKAAAPSKTLEAIAAKSAIDTDPRWNQAFYEAQVAGLKVKTNTDKVDGFYPAGDSPAKWFVESDPTIKAGSAQDSLLTWKENEKIAKELYYIAAQDTVRYPASTGEMGQTMKQKAQTAKAKLDAISGDIDRDITGIQAMYDDAQFHHNSMVSHYNLTYKIADLEKAKKSYNPDFNDNHMTGANGLVTCPTTGKPDAEFGFNRGTKLAYDTEEENWYINPGFGGKKVYAGTAQAAFLDAVWEATVAQYQANRAENKLKSAMKSYWKAYRNLLDADMNLMKALGADVRGINTYKEKAAFVKEHLKDYIDKEAEKKYQDYLDIKDEVSVWKARLALMEAYGYNPDEVSGDEDDDAYEYWRKPNKAQFSWLRSSYMADYEATMINTDAHNDYGYKVGEEMPIAVFFEDFVLRPANGLIEGALPSVVIPLGDDDDDDDDDDDEPGEVIPSTPRLVPVTDEDGKPVLSYKTSYKHQAEMAQEYVDVIAPKILAYQKSVKEEKLATFKADMKEIMDAVNAFKAKEDSYKKWIKARIDAEQKVNEAKIDKFKANKVLTEAKADYEAAKAAADGMVWMYIPKVKNAAGEWVANPSDTDGDGFVQVSIPEAIKEIEAENEEIEARKHELELDLKYGKLTYQTVMEVLDETIEVLSADIEVWTAIALKYQAIMNAYLGIVEDGVEAEPVEAEGDEE